MDILIFNNSDSDTIHVGALQYAAIPASSVIDDLYENQVDPVESEYWVTYDSNLLASNATRPGNAMLKKKNSVRPVIKISSATPALSEGVKVEVSGQTYLALDATTLLAEFTVAECTKESVPAVLAKWVTGKFGVRASVFIGDGSTTTFELRSKSQQVSIRSVLVDGVLKSGSDYTYDDTNKTIEFTSAPAADAVVEVYYIG